MWICRRGAAAHHHPCHSRVHCSCFSSASRSPADAFISPVSKALSTGIAWRKRLVETRVRAAVAPAPAAAGPSAAALKSPETGALARRAISQSAGVSSASRPQPKGLTSPPFIHPAASPSAASPVLRVDSKENAVAVSVGAVKTGPGAIAVSLLPGASARLAPSIAAASPPPLSKIASSRSLR